MQLLPFGEPHPGELLEKQPVECGNIKSSRIDHSLMPAADAADDALFRRWQPQFLSQSFIDTIAACARVDEGLDAFAG